MGVLYDPRGAGLIGNKQILYITIRSHKILYITIRRANTLHNYNDCSNHLREGFAIAPVLSWVIKKMSRKCQE